MDEPLLQSKRLEAGYDDVQVLWGISLDVAAGGMTTLVGANGAGKTTTLRAITGSITAARRARAVPRRGRDPSAPARQGRARARAGAGRAAVVQRHERRGEPRDGRLLQARARRASPSSSSRSTRCSRASQERRRQKAGTFSGGEQQMLAIGRGLMSDPEVLDHRRAVARALRRWWCSSWPASSQTLKDGGLTILLVEQNVHLALALSDYAYVIAEGRPFTEGPAPKWPACRKSGRPISGCEQAHALMRGHVPPYQSLAFSNAAAEENPVAELDTWTSN